MNMPISLKIVFTAFVVVIFASTLQMALEVRMPRLFRELIALTIWFGGMIIAVGMLAFVWALW